VVGVEQNRPAKKSTMRTMTAAASSKLIKTPTAYCDSHDSLDSACPSSSVCGSSGVLSVAIE